MKEDSEKLVVRYNESEMTINKLEDTIAMVKKDLNELVNSWGVDNIHLLLSKFK